MDEVVILGARRTAIGKFGGALATTPASALGARVISQLLTDAGIEPDQVDQCRENIDMRGKRLDIAPTADSPGGPMEVAGYAMSAIPL